MKRGRWSAADDARLRELYPVTRSSELPALLGRSRMAIKVRAANMHLRKDPEASMHRPWHPDEDAVIRLLYADTPTDGIAAVLNRSISSTFHRARKLGLEKGAEYLASPAAGRTNGRQGIGTRFPKGHVPANKGLRRPGWGPGRMKVTQFRKGQKPAKWMPVGATRIVGGYIYMKIADAPFVPWTRNWKPAHVLLWEQAHGPVPASHVVVFKNRDRADIRLDNLELVTRADLMLRNTVHNLPKPLARAVQLLGALKRKINRRDREEQNRRSA